MKHTPKYLGKNFAVPIILRIFEPDQASRVRQGGSRHRWNPEADEAVCRAGRWEKDVFKTLLSVYSNLANLNLPTAVMQLKRPRGCIIPDEALLLLYNKV